MAPVDEAAVDAFLQEGTPETNAVDSAKNYSTPEPTAQETSAPAVEEAVANEVAPESDDLPNQDTFDRAYVEKLRQESANYRTRAKKFQEAFDGYEEEAVGEWLELATTLRSDPRTAASRFKELAEAIEGQLTPEQAEAVMEQVTDDEVFPSEQPLTKAEFEKMWQQKQQEVETNQLIRQIENEAVDLGYEKGSKQYQRLLYEASQLPDGSVKKAHEALQAERQAIIDAYVAEMGGSPSPQVPGKNVGGESGQPKSFEDFETAKSALDEWLASQGSADGGKMW